MPVDNVAVPEIKPGGSDPNPGAGSTPKPAEATPAEKGSAPNPNDGKFVSLEAHETLKRQYNASTEEALRLKREKEDLEKENARLKSTQPSQRVDNDAFQQLVEREGLPGAITKVVSDVVSPLVARVDKLFDKTAFEILNDFKSKHPGLKDDVLTRFDSEFAKLKSVYGTVEEAMEKAYTIIGGQAADAVISAEAKKDKETQDLANNSKKDKQDVLNVVGEEGKDKQPNVVNPNSDIKAQIDALTAKAITRENSGNDASLVWAQIDELKRKLSASV